jgi:uncharacterized protein (TIGR02117 family)
LNTTPPKKLHIRILKATLRFVLFFLGFVALYLIAAFTLPKIAVDAEPDSNEDLAIYIKTNGVHTDIVMPVKSEIIDWHHFFRYEHTQAKDSTAEYLALGWGDKGFYLQTPTWADLKFSVAFKAAFGLSSSAIHATFYSELTEDETCRKIMISSNQYQRLIDYVKESLEFHSSGSILKIDTDANYSAFDAFYEAKGSYSLFHTCNTWANNGLKACGQKACWWTPLDKGIFEKYK